MFTGIITEVGKIKDIKKNAGNKIFSIEASKELVSKKEGASIAVDGTCLTLIDRGENYFVAEAIPETLSKTLCGSYQVNDLVNLEGALKIGDEISGHLVQGHIDGLSEIISVLDNQKEKVLQIFMPPNLKRFIAYKGSVTVNGVSLTVSKVNKDSFEVSLIPHTWENTNLHLSKPGKKVNLEIDTLARYAERIHDCASEQAEYSYLLERGFI